jgi:thiol-disulfide isomerase/thioredoxin
MNSLTKDQLINLQNELSERNSIILLKFSAKWCKPCRTIKPLCDYFFSVMPRNIQLFNIDIDEQMDLYIQLKSKKMLKGIPTMMMWAPPLTDETKPWYVADEIVSGADEKEVKNFFDRCAKVALSLQK